MVALRTQQGPIVLALEFLILTAARSGETLGARWDEIDLASKVWTLPEARMKSNRTHRVPLSPATLAILSALPREGEYVFPGSKRVKPIHDAALLELMQRMGRGDVTVHGFRATFRTWVAECTTFQRELAEAALAHVTGNEVERSYQRADLLERRRELMDVWAKFCTGH
jgi:integrase